jgi:hypothetical protein
MSPCVMGKDLRLISLACKQASSVEAGDFRFQTPCHVQSQEMNCVLISTNALQYHHENAGQLLK